MNPKTGRRSLGSVRQILSEAKRDGLHDEDEGCSEADASQVGEASRQLRKVSPLEQSSGHSHVGGVVGRVPELAQHLSDEAEVANQHGLVVAERQVGVLACKQGRT